MEDKKALLAAVADAAVPLAEGAEGVAAEQYESLLVYVKRHSSRSDDLNLGEVFQTMSKKEHNRLWTRVLEVVAPVVDEGWFLSQDEEHEEQSKDEEKSGSGDAENGEATRPAADDAGVTPANDQREEGSVPRLPSTPESAGARKVPRRPRRGAAAADSDGGDTPGETKKTKGSNRTSVSLAIEVLHAAATLAHEFLADKDLVAPRALLDTAVYLHDIVLYLEGLDGDALRVTIAKVCEMWWTQDRAGAEHLVVHLIPVMLVRSLSPDAKEADVKRMHGLKGALLLLDFDDDSSASLRALLLRTFMSPVYLKCSEGKRLLASFFGLHPTLVGEIHAVMKAQMPGAKKAVLAAYGEVYFRVWRGADGPYLEKVEMLCLQDLMHACIHASTPKMHENILVVLGGIHSQKKLKGVDAGLLRLYAPVMWRSLRVANPAVRAQACQVLVDAFPLQDPSAGAAAYDATLEQQFVALTDLLQDAHPQVRAVAAKGACRVLSVFWEMIPIDTTRTLLTRVVGQLACDGASPLVRLAAVEGLTLLLECPGSHGVLKSMLPGVQNLIHDNNKKVRCAFVKLLLVVKGVKSIKYYQVVTVDHILARLAEDHLKCHPSASGLSKLILNSYFPTGSGVTGAFQVSRCLALLSQDEGAAVAFFSRLHQNAGVPSAAKMIAMLVRCVVVAARQPADDDDDDEGDGCHRDGEAEEKVSSKGKRKGMGEGMGEEEDEDQGKAGKHGAKKGEGLSMRASDSKSMSGILNLIASIWESILPALQNMVNEPSLELIQQTVTGEVLATLYKRFSGQESCRTAFMRVAGLAGGDLAPGMLEDVIVEMLALPADAPPSAYGPTVDLLCSWGQHEHLVGAMVDSLRKRFSDTGSTMTGEAGSGAIDDGSGPTNNNTTSTTAGSRVKRRRPISRKGGGDGDGEQGKGIGIPAPLALNMLSHLLGGGKGHSATAAARDAIMANDEAVDSLEAVLVLARSAVTTRLSSSAMAVSASLTTTASAIAAKREAKDSNRRRFYPDALLVRALEALGRVYMHREASLAGDSNNSNLATAGVGTAAEAVALGGDEEEQRQAEQEMSMLQPLPFSIKMRELMVWATNTVLPVLVGESGGGDVGIGGGVDVVQGGGTPVKPAGVSLMAESPSPMPPPRARARASSGDGNSDAAAAAAAASAAAAAAAAVRDLAGDVFGVVVLLASEWVEVGSGLAEISMRADTWGNRLSALLFEEVGDHEERSNSVNVLLPQLCRLSLHLSLRESQGARPPASIWDVLLRCADRRISMSEGAVVAEGGEGSSTTCVQKFLAASVALEGRKGGTSPLLERLVAFMFTQAFVSDDEDEQANEDGDFDKGPGVGGLTRLQVRAMQDADSDDPAGCLQLQLSRPAATVLDSILRSGPASKAAGALVLSHLAAFGDTSGLGEDASWPLFCAHVLSALIEHAPGKVRLQLAADAHAGLKAVAASTCSILSSSSAASGKSENNTSSAVWSTTSSSAKEDGSREEEGVSTMKAAAFAVGAIYGRLEAARRAAAGIEEAWVQRVEMEGAPCAVAVSA